MPTNASYSGGFSPGANLYAVDGDFTRCDPCGPPEISYPFKGDSFPSLKDIVLLNSSNVYQRVGLGSGYNIQPFSPNQSCIIIDQEFMVAQAYYVPMRLNTPYYLPWAIGWTSVMRPLTDCFLVEEGPLENVGGGICKIKRRFASLPNVRNELESFAYTFPAYTNGTQTKLAKTFVVASRVQYDYYVYDDLGLLSGIPLFPSGRRLNATTGLSPTGLLLPEMRYFVNGGEATNILLDGDAALTDDAAGTPPAPTNPSFSEYIDFCGYSSNPQAEIVAEASSFGPGPWLGNIYQRKTRFVSAI